MALSGYFYGTTANARIKPKLSWSATQSIEENCSDITVTLTYSRTNSGYKTEGDWSGAITVGDQKKTGKKHIVITQNSNTVAMSATFRVFHDEYGALTVKVSAEGKITAPSDSTLQSTSISGNIQPDTIPRASSVSAADANIGSVATVVIGRKSQSFTHSLSYAFGDLSGWLTAEGEISENREEFTQAVVPFRLPESFYYEITDRPAGRCHITCHTYQGDTLIGQTQTTFTVTADPQLCAPLLTVTARDVNPDTLALTGDETKFIRYRSRVLCLVDARGQMGASLIDVRVGEQTLFQEEYILESADTDTLHFAVTDNRGYTTTVTLSLDMIPYVPLTVNATVQRADPTSGDAILTLKGICWKGQFPTVENTLVAAYTAGEQSYTAQLEIGEDHTYRKEIRLTGLDYRQSHRVEVAVSDAVMVADQSLTVQKGLPVFQWGEGDFQFHVPVDLPALTIDGVPLATYIQNAIENYVNQ